MSTSERDDRVSDAAYVLAQTAACWPDKAAYQLYEDLSHRLTAQDPVVLRESNLGLVVAAISEGTGEYPAIESYELLRTERRLEGESWPSSTTLIGVYYGWLYVVRAAMELYFSSGRVHRDPKAAKEQTITYSRQEVEDAISRCASEVGFWPSQWVYEEWAYVSRQLARAAGRVPRIPGLKQIRNRCGSFDHALEELRSREQDRTKSLKR